MLNLRVLAAPANWALVAVILFAALFIYHRAVSASQGT